MTKNNQKQPNEASRASIKDIARTFDVSPSTAKKLGTKTRQFYQKQPREIITIAQVKRANKLDR